MLYAHTLAGHPKKDWQTLQEHLDNVGRLAADFASLFGAARTGATLGTHHDAGKATEGFQRRLEGGPRVDHSTAGAVLLGQRWEASPSRQTAALGTMLSRFLAYPILGHHGGLPDAGSEYGTGLDHRLAPGNIQNLPSWDPAAIPLPASPMDIYQEMLPLICKQGRHPDPFRICFALRMLFSCLVDADYLDTERFCTPDIYRLRPAVPALSPLAVRLEDYLHRKGFLHASRVAPEELEAGAAAPCGSSERQKAIALARSFIREQCEQAAAAAPGLFSLTVPTGGGKTLSSLSFAIRHAIRHDLRRIIFVVPYTSIIEQNAQIFREALGDEVVLEHHSNFVHPDEGDDESTASLQYRLSTENWEAAVIVTTSVQFFESLFSCKPSRCRKLHNIARSVVILDEAQMIPVPFVAPCVEALRSLAGHYGTSIVLCTATQPALLRSTALPCGFEPDEVRSLVPEATLPALFRIFERVRTTFEPMLTDAELGARLLAERQVLCILNSRRHARALFERCGKNEDLFHLSAYMTPCHRCRTLQTIRERLASGLPCRVISTSLIECGVDISFPVVYRERNGLDVIAQAAGRCNRHGERELGQVCVFDGEQPVPLRAADLNRRREACALVQDADDLFGPATIRRYFQALYSHPELLDEHAILRKMKLVTSSNAALDPRFYRIPKLDADFAEIDRTFQFIESQTDSVVIESQLPEELRTCLRNEQALPSRVFRRLQSYSVQVYRWEREAMEQAGRLECLHDCVYLLSGGLGYAEDTGLDVRMADGISSADLVF